jgi:Ca2+/Na+ antiporter
MSIATLIAWGGWVFVVFTINPEEAGALSLILFYVTLFMAMLGTLAVIGIVYRIRLLKRDQLMIREVRITFRHAIMLSLALICSLFLSAQGLLTWWNFLALFVGVGVVEYLFLLMQESRRT